jgi:hypothetical protein
LLFILNVFLPVVCFWVLGFGLRVLHLLGRHSTSWAKLLACFCLVIFEIRNDWFCPGWPGPQSCYFVLPTTAGVQMHTCLPIGWDGASRTFCLGCPQTEILLISTSKYLGLQAWVTSSWKFLFLR